MLEGMTNDNVSNQYGENAWRGEVKLGEDKLGSKNMMSLIQDVHDIMKLYREDYLEKHVCVSEHYFQIHLKSLRVRIVYCVTLQFVVGLFLRSSNAQPGIEQTINKQMLNQ